MISINSNLLDSIVKGIVAGYKDYIEVRKEKENEMYISDAYAHVKSNHIENQVYRHIDEYCGFIKQNAGPAWKFLKFNTIENQGNRKVSFIFKNEMYFDEKNVTYGKNALNDKETKEKKYLKDLMNDNYGLNFEKIKTISEEPYQLDADRVLFDDIRNEDNSDGHIFTIVTYGIDVITRQLNSVKLWIPNPEDNTAVLFQDLTDYLLNLIKNEEQYFIDYKDLEVLKSDRELEEGIVDIEKEFRYSLTEEDEDESNKD